MQLLLRRRALMLGLSLMSCLGLAQAGTPLWTFTPLTPTTITVSPVESKWVQYAITNQSSMTHTLAMTPITGVSQITTGNGICPSPFTLAAHQSCTLSLNVNGAAMTGNIAGGPVVCQQGGNLQCYQPAQADRLNATLTSAPATPVLSVAPSTLALSVNDPTANAQLTGHARTITLANNGTGTATGLNITDPTWPTGTSVSSTTCGSVLAPGTSCQVTITPGPNATSDCQTGVAPTPATISFSADNANTVQTNVVVLNYGCLYQGGYVYSVDDDTSLSGSIGGKVAAIEDTIDASEAAPAPGANNWGGSGTDVGASTYDNDEQGANDGGANTNTIITALGASPAIAAVQCDDLEVNADGSACTSGTCYNNWYLPSVCEWSGTGAQSPATCTGTANINQQLFMAGVGSAGWTNGGFYWSSTEWSGMPTSQAIAMYLDLGGSYLYGEEKTYQLGVRCSRRLTS